MFKPKFRYKNAYGKGILYPENDDARLLCLIAGKPTFPVRRLEALKQDSRFEIEVVQDTLPEILK